MAYATQRNTSLFGRRLGLQKFSTATSGGRAPADFLVGAEDIRKEVTTGESTGTNLKPWGVSVCPGTSAASSAVYTLDPPIPGVEKTIFGGESNGPVFIKTKNSEVIKTTAGSSFTTIKISSLGGRVDMMGLTTGVWIANITSGTSSQASGSGLTTST